MLVSLHVHIVGDWLYRMRRIMATLCIAVLAVFAGYRVVFGANGMMVYKAKRAEYLRLQQDLADQNQRHQELQNQVKALQSDPRAIEREAREQLGYVKPGETVLVQRQPKPELRNASTLAENQSKSPDK